MVIARLRRNSNICEHWGQPTITKVMEEKYTKLNKSRIYMNTIHAHHTFNTAL